MELGFEQLFVVGQLYQRTFGLLELRLRLRGCLHDGGQLGLGGGQEPLLFRDLAGAAVELTLRCFEFGRRFGDELLGVAGAGGEHE